MGKKSAQTTLDDMQVVDELRARIRDLESKLQEVEGRCGDLQVEIEEHESDYESLERDNKRLEAQVDRLPDASENLDVIAVARHVHRETTSDSFDALSYEEQERRYEEARVAIAYRKP